MLSTWFTILTHQSLFVHPLNTSAPHPDQCFASMAMGDPERVGGGNGEGLKKKDKRIKLELGGMLPSD